MVYHSDGATGTPALTAGPRGLSAPGAGFREETPELWFGVSGPDGAPVLNFSKAVPPERLCDPGSGTQAFTRAERANWAV